MKMYFPTNKQALFQARLLKIYFWFNLKKYSEMINFKLNFIYTLKCHKNMFKAPFLSMNWISNVSVSSLTFLWKKSPAVRKKTRQKQQIISFFVVQTPFCPLPWQIFTSGNRSANVKAGRPSTCCCPINQGCFDWLSETRQEFLVLPFKQVLIKAAKLLFLLPFVSSFLLSGQETPNKSKSAD